MPARYAAIVDVHVLLVRDGQVLLAERQGTGYCDGMLHLPSGHLEAGESVVEGACREALEEVGVLIDPGDLRCAHVMHHRTPGEDGRVGFFFRADRWRGEPYNREPHKCGKVVWVDPGMLPGNTIPYAAAGIRAAFADGMFSLHGWTV